MLKNDFRTYIFLFFFALLSCSGGNQRANLGWRESIPEYESVTGREFTAVQKVPSTNFPLSISSYSFSNLKESVDNFILPKGIITEELINSFPYNYPKQDEEKALNVYTEVATSPWDTKKKLIHIGIYSNKKENESEPIINSSKNIIFAVDTSGSMAGENSMELAKHSMLEIIRGLGPQDKVTIVEYTDDARIFLRSTQMTSKGKILNSVQKLRPSGGTNAWPGILLAYKQAREMKRNNERTKVIIVTDGDFGGVNNQEFLSLVEKENKAGINISILGFGIGGREIETMNKLISTKKGEAFYINSKSDEKSFLSKQTWSSRINIATNMQIEIKFNPNQVQSFRLIGFNNFKASRNSDQFSATLPYSLTALYEVMPTVYASKNNELLSLSLSYKTNKGNSEQVKSILLDSAQSTWNATEDFRFAAGVAGLGMILNNSLDKGNLDYNMVIHLIQSALNYDPEGTRLEFLHAVNKMKKL